MRWVSPKVIAIAYVSYSRIPSGPILTFVERRVTTILLSHIVSLLSPEDVFRECKGLKREREEREEREGRDREEDVRGVVTDHQEKEGRVDFSLSSLSLRLSSPSPPLSPLRVCCTFGGSKIASLSSSLSSSSLSFSSLFHLFPGGHKYIIGSVGIGYEFDFVRGEGVEGEGGGGEMEGDEGRHKDLSLDGESSVFLLNRSCWILI